jgi:peptide/nickel transport system ATP-binding protein
VSRSGDDEVVVSVEDVAVHFDGEGGLLSESKTVKAVDGVSLDIYENDVVALVGESGCGKTTLGKTVIGLQRPTEGTVEYRGQDVWDARDATGDIDIGYSRIRRSLQIIHQDPGSALNPNRTVRANLNVPLKKYRPDMSAGKRDSLVDRLLGRVGITPAADYAERFPHQLSGGEQQRIALARTLLMQPDLILADEAVSALDVSLRVEMMDLMLELRELFDTSYLFISHDFANARYLAKKTGGRIGVMYLGELVEIGPADRILKQPQHPYTKVLVWSTPTLDPRKAVDEADADPPVRGVDIPTPDDPPTGCKFHTRCESIIPPADVNIDQEIFNDVTDLRFDIRDGTLGTDDVWREVGVDPQEADPDERAGKTEAFVERVRERAFDDTPTGTTRDHVDEALRALAEGDRDEAVETLRDRYESVCERKTPPLDGGVDHQAACHLTDDATEAGPASGDAPRFDR